MLYVFQCHSPKSSQPLPLPQSPKDCSIHQCLFCCLVWRRQWHPTPVLLPGKSHGQRNLVGYSPWGCRVRQNWTGAQKFDYKFLYFPSPNEVRDIVQETGIKTIPIEKKCKKAKWLSGEALQIAVKRREVKNKGEKERYKHLNAEFQRIERRD